MWHKQQLHFTDRWQLLELTTLLFLKILASVSPVRVVTKVGELVLPRNVNPAHGAGVTSSTMGVHPLIDAMVVESVTARVEPLGVVLKHLLQADCTVV